MITLECDNRVLTTTAKYSYLTTNYSSGVSVFSVLNSTDSIWKENAFLLVGNFGSEDTEILQILSIDYNNGEITTSTNTLFAHPESTRVTILPYSQVRFFYTTTTTYNTDNPLTDYINLQTSDWFTIYGDESHSTGYGWYVFYNPVTNISSQPSNAIPYAGFDSDTTENILSDFFSMLNNKELTLVTREDALSWASEAYGRIRNKLNITNTEFTASALGTISILADTIEYDLPSNFDHLISLSSGLDTTDPGGWAGNKNKIEFISLANAYTYTGSVPRYYLRGFKIGILPTPSTATVYHYMYLKSAKRLSLNTDEVELPNGGENIIKDFMLYRVFQKLQNSIYKEYKTSFDDGLNQMIISSIKRDAGLASWGMAPGTNV